jgi:4-carboxymuconolactone decarboxylase
VSDETPKSADLAQWNGSARVAAVPTQEYDTRTISVWDERTRRLVRVAAVICIAEEPELRTAFAEVVDGVDVVQVEEVILQSYLFAGIPRALNAMREWRRVSGVAAPRRDDAETQDLAAWRARGEAVCALVYGRFYERLRHNVAEHHPALDEWMIVDGYGKVLGRPGLDLRRRELCAVAACAVLRQEPQLHSHLHGALHVGAAETDVDATLDEVLPLIDARAAERARRLWSRVRRR